MANEVIKFEHVRLKFGAETIYEDVSFSVRRGEFVCILGPSGCGKSTSLRLIGDLLRADGGTVTVDGKHPSETWRKIAFVFQSPRLAPWRTAIDNVLLGMELRGVERSRDTMQADAVRALDLVGLAKDAKKYPRMLSGGERQRVSIARALAVDPEIILMDEPFSALDPNTRQRLRSEIISIWQKTNKTIIFVTHDIEEALYLADRVLLLSNKPARVLEEIRIDTARPRIFDSEPALVRHRENLVRAFESLDSKHGEVTT